MTTIVWPDSGELTRRITIRLWSDVPNAAFGLDQTFDTGIKRWAMREPMLGMANRSAMNTAEEATDYWWVRQGTGTMPADITLNHVVEWEGYRFRILEVENVSDADYYTRIKTKALGSIASIGV